MRPTLDTVLDEAAELGVSVQWVELPRGRRGAYAHAARTILLSAALSETMAVPVLMHEIEHARRGDDGPQPTWVEERINATVAARMIGECDYAAAEDLAGGHAGGMAVELDVPVWVVEAYRNR